MEFQLWSTMHPPTVTAFLFQKTHLLVGAFSSTLGKQALLVLLLFQLKCRCCQGSQWDVITMDSAKHCSLLHQLDEFRYLSFSIFVPVPQSNPHSIARCHVYTSLENVTRGSPASIFTFTLLPWKKRQVPSRVLRSDQHSPKRLPWILPHASEFPTCQNISHPLLGLQW